MSQFEDLEFLRACLSSEFTADDLERAWTFLLKTPLAGHFLAQQFDKPALTQIILGAEQWQGVHWATGSASRALFSLSGRPVVCATFKSYVSVLQMGLCLVWGVEFPNVSLPDSLAEAAFALAERANPIDAGISGVAKGAPMAQQPGQDVPMGEEHNDD